MKLVFDIETDGLGASVIWCIVAKDLEDNRLYTFDPSQIDEGIKLLEKADILIGHNIVGFDIPVLKKLTNISFKDKKVIAKSDNNYNLNNFLNPDTTSVTVNINK